MTQVIILEDEAKTARELAAIITTIDNNIHVLAILDSVEQAVNWFETNKHPDIIFSDIQLADGLCFDFFKKIQVQSLVIFCTAYDDYLVDAFETNAVSYLLKPITYEKAEKALSKLNDMKLALMREDNDTGLQKMLGQLPVHHKSALLVYQKEKIIPLQVKDIAFFFLENAGYIFITTLNGETYHTNTTLDELEATLNPAFFYRANRQYIISKTAVINAERFFARKLIAQLRVPTPEPIIVSKARATAFLHWLQQ